MGDSWKIWIPAWLTNRFSSSRDVVPVRFSCTVVGNTLNSHQEFIRRLKEGVPGLERTSEERSDVLLVFCPVVSRAGTEIEAALQKLRASPAYKPAVLVVLHHTFDPGCVVPDSSRAVQRKNTLTVDCLFHEDKGLLQCQGNQEALDKVTHWIQQVVKAERSKKAVVPVRFSCTVAGNTLNSHQEFIRRLSKGVPGLERTSEEQGDVLLVFCPVVSRAGTDIEAALQKLRASPAYRPAVLVVLHHTFDPGCVVPDSSRAVQRKNTLTVDCLFHEDKGLLHCQRNQEVLDKVTHWIQQVVKAERSKKGHGEAGSSNQAGAKTSQAGEEKSQAGEEKSQAGTSTELQEMEGEQKEADDLSDRQGSSGTETQPEDQ